MVRRSRRVRRRGRRPPVEQSPAGANGGRPPGGPRSGRAPPAGRRPRALRAAPHAEGRMMARARLDAFTTIHTEGGLLPADLLVRVAAGDPKVPGTEPASFHLAKAERLTDRITRSWN